MIVSLKAEKFIVKARQFVTYSSVKSEPVYFRQYSLEFGIALCKMWSFCILDQGCNEAALLETPQIHYKLYYRFIFSHCMFPNLLLLPNFATSYLHMISCDIMHETLIYYSILNTTMSSCGLDTINFYR